MSEVQTRPAASRGRGSGRGGRGGFASRGGRTSGRPNGDKFDTTADDATAFEDQGELGELKKQYGSKVSLIKELFPDWSEQDILYALQETDGDENLAVTRIAEGTISQWGEVTKKAPRSKAKESTTTASNIDSPNARPTRGGRNVSEAGRGRSRNPERGGRGGRGRSSNTPATNGTRHTKENAQPLSVPTEESNAWDTPKTADVKDAPADDPWAPKETTEKPAAPAAAAAASEAPKPAAAVPKTWASMLRQSTVPKAAPKPPKEEPAPKPAEPTESLPPAAPDVEPTPDPEPEPESQPEPAAELPAEPTHDEPAPAEVPTVIEPEVVLPPSKDQLTETNLEQVVDESHPPATATVASTAADSWDPRHNAASATATPLSASQQQHQPIRPAVPNTNSGFAASAIKATTERGSRTPSYQRRVLDQEEAVRMPGNREVDRAAVQFGAFSLNEDDDIDGDREEPETRTQPPADSPVAHPRTSLPPAPQQAPVPEAIGVQKPAPGLPTPASAAAPAPAVATPTGPAGVAPQAPASSQTPQSAVPPAQPYSRFGQAGPQEPSSFPQKSIDPFNQPNNPAAAQSQFDSFPSQQTQQNQQPGGAFSSAPSEYSSYYTADQQNRPPYNYYNQPYGQQGAQGHQESVSSQQRSFGGYNASQADNLSQYPQSGGLPNQSRYGGVTNDAQNSGHTTPNPTTQSQPAASQTSQPQTHAQQSYPYNSHPYYNNAYYSNYMNYGHYGQGGYGGGPYGKGGVYGHPYGMSPQGPYDHASSPAAGFGQSSLHRAESGLSSGLGGDFGRAGSAQSGAQPGLGGSGFGGVQDTFGRGSSSFQSPAGQGFNSTAQPNNSASATDDLKHFGDNKPGSGPSPSLGGARPGSATNTPAGQSGLPPPQSGSQMGGYGGYPSHLQGHGLHGSSGYGMGGATSGQHGSAPFGSYGQGGGYGSGYYGSGGQQQQQRGWGNNYH
ncbi:CUE domain-containing protein [Colletotrichum chlorophyti]|uniref:RNA polymerase II degradation factor 1 n=1 Tax=Colletotrichum chlorophyti TaxID=708187 RepID=A0A1Q8S6M4_9PEZI|nr:CUE domain-containing protein [Colletotrichum chlorophyti]